MESSGTIAREVKRGKSRAQVEIWKVTCQSSDKISLFILSWKNALLPTYTSISWRARNNSYLRPSYPSHKFKVRYEHTLHWPVFELNSRTGELLRSTAPFESTKLDALLKAGPIRCAAVDFKYTHLATVGDDKQLKVWAVKSLQLLSERYAPTTPYSPRILSSHD